MARTEEVTFEALGYSCSPCCPLYGSVMHVTFQGTKEPVRSGRVERASGSATGTVSPRVSFLPAEVMREGLLTI